MFVSLVLIVLGPGIAKLFLLPPSSKAYIELLVWLRHSSASASSRCCFGRRSRPRCSLPACRSWWSVSSAGLDWTILLMPVAILILALSLFFMKKA